MKKDTSNIIDLDSMLEPTQPETITESVAEEIAFEQISIDMNEILGEWSYRLPKGYPTIVDGIFTERAEVEILNQLLEERGLQTLPLPEAATMSQLSTNPTDIKEAMVCLFADAGLTDKTILDDYRACLDKNLDEKKRSQYSKTLKTKLTGIASKYGKNYGITGYAKMPEVISQAVTDLKKYKADIMIISNGVAAADAIISYKSFGMLKPGMVVRDDRFEAIRSHAVKLIESNYQIKGYYPDNWCPGDIYFFLNSKVGTVLKTQRLNVGAGSLNDYFYGAANTKGSILAVSLKMQEAQAGKATTFIKNVVVDGVTAKDKLGKDAGNQQVIKFRDLNRRLDKYYYNTTDWKKDPKAFDKVKSAVVQLNKMSALPNLPTTKDMKPWQKYLTDNLETIQSIADGVGKKLGKAVNTAITFQQAYTRFVKNLQAMNIKKVEGNSQDFVKQIEEKNKKDNGGKLDTVKMQGLLSQKAATYDLASTLIEKWTEKTKRLSPAFAEHLNRVKNPFVAITMFAIAQHGLNPNFYKAIGRNDASKGTISEFPTNSVVDEKKSVQQLKVKDSPGQAGFYIEYNLSINNHTYKTTLVFRFSKDQIRIEVEELTAL